MPKQKHQKHINKKFTRSDQVPGGEPRIHETDIKLFKKLFDYRLLDTTQILALLPGDKVSRQIRLQRLYHARYLDRPPEQQTGQFRPGNRRADLVYAIGQRGVDMLANNFTKNGQVAARGRLFWQQQQSLDWGEKNLVSFPFIWHTIMTGDFRATTELALAKHRTARLKTWAQGEELKERVKIKGKKGGQVLVPVIPDGGLVIENNLPKKIENLPYCLEADRSTMPLARYVDKIAGYEKLFKQAIPPRKDPNSPPDWSKAKRQLGVPLWNYRVLTVTLSEQRKQNLMDALRTSGLFKEIKSGQKKGQLELGDRYWFTCEISYNLDQPNTILQPIWQSLNNKNFHLLE